MDYKKPKGDTKWEDVYKFLYLPLEPSQSKPHVEVRQTRSILKKTSFKDKEEKSTSKGKTKKKKSESPTKSRLPDPNEPHPVKPVEKPLEKPPVRPEERSKIPWYRPPAESVSSYSKPISLLFCSKSNNS